MRRSNSPSVSYDSFQCRSVNCLDEFDVQYLYFTAFTVQKQKKNHKIIPITNRAKMSETKVKDSEIELILVKKN
jgi:hypothetical protein